MQRIDVAGARRPGGCRSNRGWRSDWSWNGKRESLCGRGVVLREAGATRPSYTGPLASRNAVGRCSRGVPPRGMQVESEMAQRRAVVRETGIAVREGWRFA